MPIIEGPALRRTAGLMEPRRDAPQRPEARP